MTWFNYWGLIFICILMVPNIIYFATNKQVQTNAKKILLLEVFEQIGRYGCFILMILNIPYTFSGFLFDQALMVYLIVDFSLLLAYILVWIVMWKKENLMRAILLSVLPSILFLFSGVFILSYPLIVCATIFSVFHITISVRNSLSVNKEQ